MKRLSSLLFLTIVACILLLVAAAVSCTSTQERIFAGTVSNLNERISSAYVTASDIAFTGKVVDANGMWLDNYLVIIYLNGEEIARDTTRLQKFPESEVGAYNGLFKIEVNNVYELSTEDHFILSNEQIMTMSNSEGFVGNTSTVYKWFGDLPPGTVTYIRVPKKQIVYALYVSPTAISSLDAEILYGKTELTEAGDVVPYVYADGVTSAVNAQTATTTVVATTVPDDSAQVSLAKAGQISWTYRLTGFYGTRWEAWEKYIVGRVPGIEWVTFKEQVLSHNPHLVQDGFVFYADKTYILPEIR